MPSKTKSDSVRVEAVTVNPRLVGFRGWMREARFTSYAFLKRVMDFVLSASFLVILSPMFLIVAILIKIDSPGPVFFRQERTGKNGKIFRICKFRSMAVDELPQLFTVLFGQMSFIGPRPWVVEYWENMNETERGRAKVRPGITGLAQAKGRNGLSIFEKIGYDLEYVEHYSLRQDIKVVFLTIATVVKGEEVNVGKSGIRDEIGALKTR